MEQGLHIGEATRTKGAKAVPVSLGVNGDESSLGLRYDDFGPEDALLCQVSRLAPKTKRSCEIFIRVFDLIGSLAMLILSLPIMLLVAAAIKIFSPGVILYKQQRVGKAGRLFTLYKFRTMVENAEKHVGPVWAAKDDDRVTGIGRVMRSTRLDELPQLFNVLRGDMSLVGPRPERPFFVQQHKALQGIRLAVKPGITGLAQVRSYYNLKPEHKLKYDYLYIQRRSLLFNIYILLQTIPVIFTRRGW
jgi:lipopolysaccharide/colanic/teichoic acid biosynthesis glycosyltransferase